MPGCVRARTIRNKELVKNDEKGNLLVCDGPVFEMPSFTIGDGEAAVIEEKLESEETPQIKNINPPQETKKKREEKKPDPRPDLSPDLSSIDLNQQAKLELPCPRPDSPPPGAPSKLGNKIVLRYEKNGEVCETIYQDRALFDVINSYVPPATTLGSTALIATTSVVIVTSVGQPVAKWVQGKLKGQVKSFSKKITKKILAMKGKKPKVLSVTERRKEQRLSRK